MQQDSKNTTNLRYKLCGGALRRMASGSWREVSPRMARDLRQLELAVKYGWAEEGPSLQTGWLAFRLTATGLGVLDAMTLEARGRE